MIMKKIIFGLLVFVGIGITILSARFLLGGSEDTWICEDGVWVRHGNPSASRPLEGCGREIAPEEEPIIGGDKDEHECLGSAGYRFNEEIGACIRDWELDENQKKAAKIGVEALGLENPTIIEVSTARCLGCFTVTLEAGKNRLKATIRDWLVVEQSMTPEECINQSGRTVNTTGDSGCEAGEEQIGEVTGFISPNICCKASK